MILLSIVLVAFAAADLVRWSPETVSRRRAWLAAIVGVACSAALAAAAGQPVALVLIAALGVTAVLAVWLWLTHPHGVRRPVPALLWAFLILVLAFTLGAAAKPAGGALDEWYRDLPYPFVGRVPLDQFVLATCAGLFLLAAGNQVVRLVLDASGTSTEKGESALKGGRVLGPMERLFVAAMVVSGA